MSNIYSIITDLASLKASDNLSEQQDHFITKLIDGEQGASGWNKLERLVKSPMFDQIDNVLQSITNEIQQTSYINLQKPFFNFSYIKTLKKASAELAGVQKFREKIMNPENPQKTAEFRKKKDIIFQQTVDTYNGTIMLPVAQGLDVRMGLSNGECFGYVAEWSNGLLHNKKVFGVNSSETHPPFKPVRYDLPVGKKYPELNHIAVLTSNISIYQSLQGIFNSHKLVKALSRRYDKHNVEHNDEEAKRGYYHSVDEVAKKLLNKADLVPEKMYNLNVMGYRSGHAMGFCKINEKYHFF